MAHKYAHLPYRRGVGVMLLNKENLVFVACRIDTTSEAWQMPQGGIDDGEEPERAAFRELEEETGITRADVKLLAKARDWMHYDLPEELVPLLWRGQFRGQEQMWFVMRLTGDEAAIDIATEHPEFLEWKWVPIQQLPELIVPFKRELYAQLVAEFASLAA